MLYPIAGKALKLDLGGTHSRRHSCTLVGKKNKVITGFLQVELEAIRTASTPASRKPQWFREPVSDI